jgi:hypothetical protein
MRIVHKFSIGREAHQAGRLARVVFLFCFCAGEAGAVGWPEIFDPYSVCALHLEIATQDWDRVRFDQPSQSEDWVPEIAEAWLRGEGEDPIRVTVRRKGESDIPLPSAGDPRKVSLKIDINALVPGQRWHGLRKLSLENGSTAPLREGFAWLVHRQAEPLYGYPAALSGWVRLFINGEEVGVYTSTEQRDETFLRNRDLYSPACSWLYKVDAGTLLEVGVSNSPAYNYLQFAPFISGPGGGKKPPPGPDFDVYLPQWVNMRGMLTLAACNAFTENSDSLFTHDGKNTFCADFDPPSPRTRLYFPWDLDTGINQGTASIYGTTTYQTTILNHPWFGRVYEHILRELLDGPLSVDALTNGLARMQPALTAAFATDPYVYPDGVAGEFAALRQWAATRNASIRTQFRYPFVPRPAFNHPGGEVAPGFALTMSAPTGTVYYTLDGTDPRAPGGLPHASAAAYSAPLAVDAARHVIARTLVGTNWCGLPSEATFAVATHGSDLRVTEILYNPLDLDPSDSLDNDAYEFIEFRNAGAATLDLSTFACDGITFTFPSGFTVAPGAFFVLVRNPTAFSARYPGVPYRGVYLGKLDNGGEKIRVRRADGTTVVSVEYDDDPPWPLGPDGLGYSLVNAEPDGNPDDPANWRTSASLFGSPAAADPSPAYATAPLINEVLTHTDPPLEDAVELHNPSDTPAAVGGWWLSDSARDASGNLSPALLKKYRIPDGTVIPARGFAVLYENAFNGPSALSPFALSENGEHVYLSAADASGNLLGAVTAVGFPALENGVSYGRVDASDGPRDTALAARTFGADSPANLAEFRTGVGAANAAPRVGPAVINEIMYNPPSNLTEYVEIHNVSGAPVDLSGWKLNGAGGFTFPLGAALPAGGFALVADTNMISADAFRADRNVPENCAVYGVSMTLDNNGERLTLVRPNTNPLDAPWPVDSVRYNDKAPWPTEADGAGPSLERHAPSAYGDDPLNWRTSRAGGSPGRTNLFDAGLAVTSRSRWKYRAVPASLGTAWRETGYADTLWPDGDGPLGYGEEGLATAVPYGPDATNRYPTTYFRKLFSLPDPPAQLTRLTLEAQYDDGFVAYLNGTEVARRGLEVGGPAYDTLATDHESGAYEAVDLGAAGLAALQQGVNLLAVEVHQSDPASQDLVWDARLTYETATTEPAAAPTAAPAGGLFIDPLSVTLACATPGATIRHTLNGTTPDEASAVYTAPLSLEASTVLKARAYALDFAPSPITTLFFERIEQDGDDDGLPDAWERLHFASIGDVSGGDDSDNDGVPNADEYVCGTDPNDARSSPRVMIESDSGALRVRFLTIPTDRDSLEYRNQNRYYSLQTARSLGGDGTLWNGVPTMDGVLGDGLTRDYPVPTDQPAAFYKLHIWLTAP